MIAWWMAQLALLGTLLAVAAFGAEAALKVARRPTRWAWMAALAMTVALGALAPMRRAPTSIDTRVWQQTDGQSVTAVAIATENMFTTLRSAWSDVTTSLSDAAQRGWLAWHGVMPHDIERWLLLAWTASSVIALVAFTALHWQFRRRRSQWPLGTLRGTPVRITTHTGPAVIGVTSTEIVVPQWLLARDDREQELVLAHETEHVRAHDPLLLALAQSAVVLLPWHPAVWFIASRLRLAVELDCDRRVLQRGASARDYGTLLIDLTDHRTGFRAAMPAFSCSPTHLERRLVAMTPTRLKYPLVRAIVTTAFASLALLAACEARLPTSEELDRMTASSATAAARRIAMIDTATVRYFIDGRTATRAETDKLSAEQIATVNVTQQGAEGGGEVRIVTRTSALGGLRTPPTALTQPVAPITSVLGDLRTFPTPPTPPIGPTRTGFTGLMIVDGVIMDPAVANRIAPDQIVTVNVTKGAAAASQYSDPRAANGVITIVTKTGVKR
jgi:beta-lactamase regulating signal transducer with metallopeptidase domain